MPECEWGEKTSFLRKPITNVRLVGYPVGDPSRISLVTRLEGLWRMMTKEDGKEVLAGWRFLEDSCALSYSS
jgi:hypothetical protein